LLERTLNLGILAHVDAGKTTLTERLLYAAGVIDAIGSVDDGTTQTDSLALEQRRGITIKSAVVSFPIDDVTVNLIDTPGHPDFIAEVERVLSVLDGAVLVVSAVEGVQSQTPLLWRALRRLQVPTLFFVNKTDRRGADPQRVLAAIAERLTPAAIAVDASLAELAAALAEHDDELLAAYVDGDLARDSLRGHLVDQTRRGLVHPVFFGSALTGAGVDALRTSIPELLPAVESNGDGPLSGFVFKIERGPVGERVAFVRMFSGTVRTRDRLRFGDDERKVTAIRVFDDGSDFQRPSITAGEIGKLWGLGDIRIGDSIGAPPRSAEHHFAPPTLETVVVPARAEDKGALRVALGQLAEQDPLIDVRQDAVSQELFVSLYGEVQKEVIQATLAEDYGIDVGFKETTTICIERLVGRGEAAEFIRKPPNPFLATVGLRIEPAGPGSGVQFGLEIELGSMPLAFFRAVEDSARETLQQGLHGWEVRDCAVTMTHSGYAPRQSHAHQGFAKEMSSTGADFRGLTPLVVISALDEAGTVVCEPIHHFHLEVPAVVLGQILAALARLHAVPDTPATRGSLAVVEGEIPAAQVNELRQQLPALARGEGVLESEFDRYEPVRGAAPSRARTDLNPLNRAEYLLRLARRAQA
jgi:ribosomal protection tetracycline resistance protein